MLWNTAKHYWCVSNRSNLPTEMAAPDRTTINSLWITLRWIRLLKYLIVMHQLGCFLTKLRPYQIMSNTCTEQGTNILKKTISISPCSFPPLANTGATVFRMLMKIFWLDEIISLNKGEKGSLQEHFPTYLALNSHTILSALQRMRRLGGSAG